MKKEMIRVTYYKRDRYSYKRHAELMTYHEYLDLLLEDDVIIKRKVWTNDN